MAQQVADYEHYKRLKLLGEGAFGKAFLAECVSDGSLCVIKQVDLSKMNDQEKKDTLREAKILESFDHPNIVRFKEVYKTKKGRLCIVMDYADGGDLAGKIKDQRGMNLPETQILDWFTQICLALKHVHDRKIIHRDLKGQNIFLTKTNIVKLGDFGIARVLNVTKEYAKTMVGTPYYLSPEIINGKAYSFKSDIWSLGVVLYELCALKPPFDAQSLTFLAMKIVKGQYSPVPMSFSRELKNLVASLLQVDPLKRPSVNEVLKFPIIQNRIQNFLSKSVKIQEFSHTVLHKQQFVKNNVNFADIKSVNNEAPIPQHLLKAQQQQQQQEDKNAQKPPLPKQIYQPPVKQPVPNLFPPQDAKPKIPVSNESPQNNNKNQVGSYLPQSNNNTPQAGANQQKNNYHYKNLNPQPVQQEPFRGPKITEVQKDQRPDPKNEVKEIQQQVRNILNNFEKPDVKAQPKGGYDKYIPSQLPQREQARPVNDPQKGRDKGGYVGNSPFDPVVKQIAERKVEKKVDREILGGGGGGMAFNFAPSSNKNANAKKDGGLLVAGVKKNPSSQQTPKRAEQEKREKEQAQQKIAEMKRKMEDEKAKKEKRAIEEAERKQVVENQRAEKEKARDAERKRMMADIKSKMGGKRGVQVEVYDLRGKSLTDIQDSPESVKTETIKTDKITPPKTKEPVKGNGKKQTRGQSLADKINQKLNSGQSKEEEEVLVAKPLPKKQLKKAFSKNAGNKGDGFVEIFVPGKRNPLNEDEVNKERTFELPADEEVKSNQNSPTRKSDYDYPGHQKKGSVTSDTGRILDSVPDLDDDKEDPFIEKLEQDIKFYDNDKLLDPKDLENLQDITKLIDELNNAVNDEAQIGEEQAENLLDRDMVEQEDRDDDIDAGELETNDTNQAGSEANEETIEGMMDYGRLECLKMKLENILGIDTFLNAYRIIKDLLSKYTLNEIEELYGKDNYASLFPFMSEETLKHDIGFVFTYVICEEKAESY